MFDHSSIAFSDKEKITILFKEYDTLRSEIAGRAADKNQLMAIGVAFCCGVFAWGATHPPHWLLWVALSIAAGAFTNMTRVSYRDICFISDRIAVLEETINLLCGADLLLWESRIAFCANNRAKRNATSRI